MSEKLSTIKEWKICGPGLIYLKVRNNIFQMEYVVNVHNLKYSSSKGIPQNPE